MREVYLDNAASTRVSDIATKTALFMMSDEYANPSSLHSKGFQAQQLLEAARRQVASAIGAADSEIVFCSGGTEANNLAVLGSAAARCRQGQTIITTAAEHSSVFESVKHLEAQGFIIKIIPPASDGSANIEEVCAAVNDDTILVSCMYVNSETGAITDIPALAAAVKRRNPKVLFHTDAVQALGKIRVTVRGGNIDLMSISGHKLHAPKGTGALFVRRGVRILPIIHGGGQENALRAGTQSTPLCCAFGAAVLESFENFEQNYSYASELTAYFRKKAANFEKTRLNSPETGSPYIQNISMSRYKSETVLHFLAERGVYASSGSACAKGKRSRILTAMGLHFDLIDSALRISFSRYSTTDDIDTLFESLEIAAREIAHG